MADGALGRQSEFRSLFDRLEGVVVWTATEPQSFDYVSAGVEGIWGVPADEMEADASRMIEGVHPEDRERVRSVVARTGEAVTRDEIEHRVVRPDGAVRWVHARLVPIQDEAGQVTEVVGVTTDITDQKRREEELEVLNRILRHDVRNDMNVVTGWLSTIEDAVSGEDAEALERAQSASEHVVELTDIAREYVDVIVGGADFDLRAIDLAQVLETELATRRQAHPEAEFRVVDDLPPVHVAANELLGSVFRNLLVNAVQHTDAATPTVDLSVSADDETVRVAVADDGPGIPADRRDRLFGRGQAGLDSDGTGMGLYLCRKIVNGYGGRIWVEDNDPRGAVFYVELIRADAP